MKLRRDAGCLLLGLIKRQFGRNRVARLEFVAIVARQARRASRPLRLIKLDVRIGVRAARGSLRAERSGRPDARLRGEMRPDESRPPWRLDWAAAAASARKRETMTQQRGQIDQRTGERGDISTCGHCFALTGAKNTLPVAPI